MSAVKVDPEVIEAAIKEYESIREEVEDARKQGVVLTKVEGPGRDVPSQVYANAANVAGRKHQLANEKLRDTIQARIDLLQATLDQYRQTDQGKAADLKPKD